MKLSFGAISVIGNYREENEDRFFADPELELFIVADGMGGHSGGGLAAQFVVENLPELLAKRRNSVAGQRGDNPDSILARSVFELSEKLRNENGGNHGPQGMGSTVTALLVQDRRASVCHLGDSRAYLWRDANLRQLTNDHTIAQLLVDSGDISLAEAATHPFRGQLTRFVGMPESSLPESHAFDLLTGDVVLLCSDGLRKVEDAQMHSIINEEISDPQRACNSLVRAAEEAGGKDNITVVAVCVEAENAR